MKAMADEGGPASCSIHPDSIILVKTQLGKVVIGAVECVINFEATTGLQI